MMKCVFKLPENTPRVRAVDEDGYASNWYDAHCVGGSGELMVTWNPGFYGTLVPGKISFFDVKVGNLRRRVYNT